MSSATQAESQQRQSAAAPSPFTPSAEYAFLSNCHTGALVAPDGAIDWLCVPSFDSPSVFGSLLDREAGFFRFAPFDINHPAARHYDPGTNVLITTWKTPSGWIVVFDALTMGPREGDDTITPHTRPPADDDADHVLVGRSSASRGRSRSSLSASRSSITGESRPIRRQDRPSPGQLPASVLASCADRGNCADHPLRARVGDFMSADTIPDRQRSTT